MIHTDGRPTVANGAGDRITWDAETRAAQPDEHWLDEGPTTDVLAESILAGKPVYTKAIAKLANAESAGVNAVLSPREAIILLNALEVLSRSK